MDNIPQKIKLELLNKILLEQEPFGYYSPEDGIMDFLSEIWDLKNMPSEDSRFKNAFDDIVQHTINNYDYDIDYLFIERLKLLEGDEKYFLFLESILNPKYKKNEDDILKVFPIISPYLEKYGYKLYIFAHDENKLPIYKISLDPNDEHLPFNVKKNNIEIIVEKYPSGYASKPYSHKKPSKYPALILVFDDKWNDYSIQSLFWVFYYDLNQVQHEIGEIKIITNNEEETVKNIIPEKFTKLNKNFCSLGQHIEFYEKLKELLDLDFESILFALNDIAFFPQIQEDFENLNVFKKSLIRYDSAERLLREAKFLINKQDMSDLYSFTYIFKPLFSNKPLEVNFNFDSESEIPNRIYALIGKNGTGKTQLISSLPIDIYNKKANLFKPNIPLFSKVIAVSYSIFDKFEIPKKSANFNYIFCGLRNDSGEVMSERGLTLRFHNTCKKIKSLERIDKWRKILLNFIEEEILNEFIVNNYTSFEVNIDGFNRIKNKFSSGQNIILYIITEIVANIRFDTLILYDEPETHLHPNAISQLINTIYDLVNEFESYCIIVTHSPLIIREIFSKNVYVIERHENVPSVRKIGIESFGENLSLITDEVFSNKEIPKQYKKIIKKLVSKGKSFEEIISILQSDNIPVSLNIRIFTKSILGNNND